MYPQVRIALVLLFLGLTVSVAMLAVRGVSSNLALQKSWRRTQAIVFGMAADNSVEVSFGNDAGDPRVNVPVDHKIGLSFLKRVPVYVNPADPSQVRMAGWLQVWLWPAALVGAALVLLAFAVAAGSAKHIGDWMLSPAPPPLATGIRVFRPASEWKMPLVWSLLGAASIASSLWIRGGTRIQHIGLGSIGLIFMLLMWGLALDNGTTEISADTDSMRKTTAFGWCQVRWDQVGSVEERRMVLGRGQSLLRNGKDYSFPGRDATTLVFTDSRGRMLISTSARMEPRQGVEQLLALCAERTGHRKERRTIYERNF